MKMDLKQKVLEDLINKLHLLPETMSEVKDDKGDKEGAIPGMSDMNDKDGALVALMIDAKSKGDGKKPADEDEEEEEEDEE